MKIAFFGDSYCAHCEVPNGYTPAYETYIKKIQQHYNADIVNIGVNGSSIYDVLLLQVKPFISNNNYPDVCVFLWTNYGRIFHRTYRGMNLSSLCAKSKDKLDPVWNATNEFFMHLLDWELQQFQYLSALEYFDRNTLSKFPSTTKIVHMWCFEKLYDWQHGVEVNIPGYDALVKLATDDRKIPEGMDWALNHLNGERKNNLVFNSLKHTIDNYETTNE